KVETRSLQRLRRRATSTDAACFEFGEAARGVLLRAQTGAKLAPTRNVHVDAAHELSVVGRRQAANDLFVDYLFDAGAREQAWIVDAEHFLGERLTLVGPRRFARAADEQKRRDDERSEGAQSKRCCPHLRLFSVSMRARNSSRCSFSALGM